MRHRGFVSNSPCLPPSPSFTTAVRNVFLQAWRDALKGYESYVIVPDNADAWLAGQLRVQSACQWRSSSFSPPPPITGAFQGSVFDSLAFLSDQPGVNVPFLSAFFETQIFSSFIDGKLTSLLTNPQLATPFDRMMGSQRRFASTDELVRDFDCRRTETESAPTLPDFPLFPTCPPPLPLSPRKSRPC